MLNATYEPLKVVDWTRAITLWVQGKVEIIETHEREVRAVTFSFKLPSVVRLLQMVRLRKRPVVQFTRANIYARDEFTCQYCTSPDVKVMLSDLTWKPAVDVQVGEEIVGIDEHRPGHGKWRKVRRATVTRSVHFVGPRVRVQTSMGDIIVSHDHRFLASDPAVNRSLEWTHATSLTRGMVIKFLAKPWTDRSDSWLAGLIDGEGALDATRGRLTLAQNDGPVLARLRRELLADDVPTSSSLVSRAKSDRCYAVSVCALGDILAVLGSRRPARLIGRAAGLLDGHIGLGASRDAVVKGVELLPPGALVGLTTTTGTLITDGFVSHNCAKTFEPEDLTFDHVIPVAQGGRRGWENIVTACEPCNRKKAARTPAEAGLTLLRPPRRPLVLAPTMKLSIGWKTPASWQSWLYWHVSLEKT